MAAALDADQAFLLTLRVAGAASTLNWLEFYYLSRKTSVRYRGLSQHLLDDPRLPLLSAMILLMSPWQALQSLALIVLLVRIVRFSLLTSLGQEGSDNLSLVVLTFLTIGSVCHTDPIKLACVTLIALNVTVSYAIAGVSKLFGLEWRSGRALGGILQTRDFGLAGRLPLPSDHVLLRISTWSLLAVELCFPAAAVLGGWTIDIFLVAGTVFHFGAAVTSGLNRFLPWFLSTYPCLYVSSHVYGVFS